jgi:replicative DNA helicase
VKNEKYTRKVLPFIKPEYFQDRTERVIFEHVYQYVDRYNNIPTKEALIIEIDNDDKLSEDQFGSCIEIINDLEIEQNTNIDWLLDNTEKWCQDKSVYNAIMESISIIDGKSDKSTNALPELLQDALSVSFDGYIGHDFLDDAEKRFEFYNKVEDKIQFDLDMFNKITKGGLPKKTLNVILAGTGVGKSLAMCHFAAANLNEGKNVLYITMEMAEEKIAERIDSNLLNVPIKELPDIPKSMYDQKIDKLRAKTPGKLIIKEYPTASAGAGHFRHLLNELKLKRNFLPDIIYIDYLNICTSTRMKYGANVNSYTLIKAIAEELRGLAVEKNVPIISATQTTRSGYTNSDPGLEDTSESFGLPATADFMFALITTEEMEALDQIMVKQLKNRYNDPTLHKRFVIGVDRSKMRLYDVEQTAQEDILDGPVMDNTSFGERWEEESKFRDTSTLKF